MAAYAPPASSDPEHALRTGWFTRTVHERGQTP